MLQTAENQNAIPKMLIADDDPAIVRLLADRCAKMGFAVEIATNGVQALIKANRSLPDILVIDINMPEADGLSVCTRLLDPAKNSFDVVVVTGSRDSEMVKRCESMGAFYAHKGPNFWSVLASALIEIFPNMADKIKEQTLPLHGEIQNRPRVLLVDDDPEMEKIFASRLGKVGVELLFATDAIQGYRIACKAEPSVIITDYFMPKGDAFYLLWRLRTTPSTVNIPVVVLSGKSLDESTVQNLKREICGHPGAVQIFKKSFDTQEIFVALQKFCGFEKYHLEA